MASKDAHADSSSKQRFTDISGEHKRMLAPIAGYEKMPLVSIDKAVEPLVEHVAGVKRMVWTVKQNCSSPAHGLTPDESASIMLYTLEWTTRETSFYFIFNRCLRVADRSQMKPWFLYLKLLVFSLSKLPRNTRPVYRGVREDLHDAYPKGSTFVWWGFSSCTTTIGVLSQPNFLGTTGARTIFNIESDAGKDISKHSVIPTENEVLLLAARQFEVIDVLHPAKDLYIVQVREIEPPFPLIEPLDEPPTVPKPSPNLTPGLSSIPPYPARWQTTATTVAGGRGQGDGRDQLSWPRGLFVDEDRTVYIADTWDHRIMAWKAGATTGEVLAGGEGKGQRLDQLQYPTDVIVDRETLLICDQDNRRVMRWPRRSSSSLPRQGEIVIDNIACLGLTMDAEGALYVSDGEKHEVRRYDKGGDKKGALIAGGHGKGDKLNQLNWPTYLFVDAQSTLYVSDEYNHRVIAWKKGAKEGIVVAGGNGEGGDLTQLSHPRGVWVDGCGHVYVADRWNHRVVRWEKGAKQGTVIVGGNGEGAEAHQLSRPIGLFFDRHGHLYVADCGNHRVQRFSLL